MLTDDFRIEDAKGRHFSPDAEVTMKLIESTDRSVLAEKLQPGVDKQSVQGFRLPADALEGMLTLVIPEKGVFKLGEDRVVLLGQSDAGAESWRIKPVSPEFFQSILDRTQEVRLIPPELKGIVCIPASKAAAIKNDLRALENGLASDRRKLADLQSRKSPDPRSREIPPPTTMVKSYQEGIRRAEAEIADLKKKASIEGQADADHYSLPLGHSYPHIPGSYPRIWLDLTPNGDKKQLSYDFLEVHDFDMKMLLAQAPSAIREALKKAESTTKATDGF